MRIICPSFNIQTNMTASFVLSGCDVKSCETAKTISADLILLNAHRPGTQFHTLGSHAAQIMRHAECSVLVRR
ncbi:MAG: hypothetical protein EBT90_13865 [Rhodobacteraceae bacterium]|nr:hypothetical protein [Paracoccaceae bacterium]